MCCIITPQYNNMPWLEPRQEAKTSGAVVDRVFDAVRWNSSRMLRMRQSGGIIDTHMGQHVPARTRSTKYLSRMVSVAVSLIYLKRHGRLSNENVCSKSAFPSDENHPTAFLTVPVVSENLNKSATTRPLDGCFMRLVLEFCAFLIFLRFVCLRHNWSHAPFNVSVKDDV